MTQIINVDEDQKSQGEEEKEEKENLDFEEFFFTNFDSGPRKMLEDLQQADPDFDKIIEQLLSKLGQGTDLTQIQSEILLLIREKLDEVKKEDQALEAEIDDKKSEKISNHIRDLSQYLIKQRSAAARNETKRIVDPQDKYQYLSKDSLANLKATIKRFIIYELYKIVNPHKIAGETRKQTFIHNVILRGLSSAKHYEGGSESEIKRYGQKMVKDLENKHKSFKGKNNLFR